MIRSSKNVYWDSKHVESIIREYNYIIIKYLSK
ncbi:hypothetical protein c7_R1329 [Megavirus courdo7]|uniref:Uncharacterized protein n=1 Tax=Megavirus courdo7 TaxID=1128135 RepID=H2ECR8_9VIRU|nr:hypothetical protein c7_R1329 [Megavirus courdo7]